MTSKWEHFHLNCGESQTIDSSTSITPQNRTYTEIEFSISFQIYFDLEIHIQMRSYAAKNYFIFLLVIDYSRPCLTCHTIVN